MSKVAIRYVSAISRALMHGYAPTIDQEAGSRSLRQLSAYMRANAIGINDLAHPGTTKEVVPEGWSESQFPQGNDRIAPQQRNFTLRHLTHAGRLSITAMEKGVDLTFSAGPNHEHLLSLNIRETAGDEASFAISYFNEELLKGHPDRIYLLVDINRAAGGDIYRFLKKKAQEEHDEFQSVRAQGLLQYWHQLEPAADTDPEPAKETLPSPERVADDTYRLPDGRLNAI